jgi:hypothetical protein
VLGVLHDPRGADEGAEARRDVGALGEIAADELVELGGFLAERRRPFHHGAAFGIDEEDDLVGADVRQAERALRNDPVGLERLETADEIEEQVVVGLPAPDFLDVALGAGPKHEHRQRASLLEPVAEVVDQDRDGGKPGLAVVQPRALLEPFAPEGDELALLGIDCLRRRHEGRVTGAPSG